MHSKALSVSKNHLYLGLCNLFKCLFSQFSLAGAVSACHGGLICHLTESQFPMVSKNFLDIKKVFFPVNYEICRWREILWKKQHW